nr:protein kinase [Acidobacteriota bacterium]
FEILKRDGSFAQVDVLRWTMGLLDALDYLHSQSPPVIHRDIKPQNLKITTRGDVILLDFGLAKLSSDDTQNALSVFGYSRKYSPLEQIQGTGTDARSDIFALGATMYHLLTGKPPVDVLARASAIVAGNADPLKPANEINNEIPASIASVLNSALALNSAVRFATAKAMRQALENAINSVSPEKTEAIPLPVATVDSLENGTIVSAVIENFPALEAFAAEAASGSPQTGNSEVLPAAEILIPNSEVFSTTLERSQQSTFVVEDATKISSAPRRPNRSRFNIAALLILLGCVGLAAGYFITRADSSDASNEPTTIESAAPVSNTIVEQTAVVTESPAPEMSEAALPEKRESTKSVARVKPEPVAEKRETVVRRETEDEAPTQAETTEKPKAAAPEKPQPSRPSSRRSAPHADTQRNGESRTRVVEAPASDIESIFTGRTSSGREEKLRRQEERRRQREQMTDEELRKFRRLRREERRRRQNVNPFPF